MRSETESENTSLSGNSDIDAIMLGDPYRLTVHFIADSHEVYQMMDMYQPVIDWVDPDLHIFKISERTCEEENGNDRTSTMKMSCLPSVSLMVFLHEEGMLGCERIQTAKVHFEKSPWKFHHSEQVARGRVNPYPYNSQDFYYTSEELPLWAVRQVHYGKEHIRIVVFTSETHWNDMLQFYKLIIGSEPDLQRNDFCLFTVHSHLHYDIQFALKRLQETQPRPLESIKLQFRVAEVGHIVPLFPNICQPLSDTRWQTTDHDGNVIVLEVTGGNQASPLDKLGHVSRQSSDRSNKSNLSQRTNSSDQSDKTVSLSSFYV